MIGPIARSVLVCATLVASLFVAAGIHANAPGSPPALDAGLKTNTSIVGAADVDARLDVVLGLLAHAEATGSVDATLAAQIGEVQTLVAGLDAHTDAALLVKIRAKLD